MLVAIASDLHENFFHLEWFLAECKKRNFTACIFLGDAINPGIVKRLADAGMSICFVWGNNDADKVRITRILLEKGHDVADYCFDETEIEGKKVFITHYPLLGEIAAASGKYDAVFYGHDHQKAESTVNNTLLVNPGELSGHQTGTVTFYIWNTETNTGEFVTNPAPKPAKQF